MTQNNDLAPFDPDYADSDDFYLDVPERFVAFVDFEGDLDAAWGDWIERNYNSEGPF